MNIASGDELPLARYSVGDLVDSFMKIAAEKVSHEYERNSINEKSRELSTRYMSRYGRKK